MLAFYRFKAVLKSTLWWSSSPPELQISHQGHILTFLKQTFKAQSCQAPAEAQVWALNRTSDLSFTVNMGRNTLKLLYTEGAYDYIGVHICEK